MTHIRLVMAKVLSCYDITFGPEVNIHAIEGDMCDQMSARLGQFSLQFKDRGSMRTT